MQNNQLFLSVTGIPFILSLGTITGCQHAEVSHSKGPNILFIMADDHAWQAVSAYQERFSKVAPTPNIDRIASQGMRFDRCLVTNSISGPSRAVILTGKYSHLNGFISNERDRFDSTQQTFPRIMKASGYQTALVGKWHLGSMPVGFDYWDILPGQGNYYNPDFINSQGKYREHGYVTDIITHKALEWLKNGRKKGEPFLLMVHHKAPHREWLPGPKYLERFKGVQFPEPPTLFDNYAGRGSAASMQDMTIGQTMRLDADLKIWTDTSTGVYRGTVGRMDSRQLELWNKTYQPIIGSFLSQDLTGDDLIRWKYQRYMYDYLACIQSVDESVGVLLDYLKESGLDKNTVVIYTSDQGFYLGEHGWFDKRFMYEESYRTPLLVAWPGVTKPGSVSKEMVSNLDFAETFLEIAGIPVPDDMQGMSMVPLLRGNPVTWRKEHYYHYYEYPGVHSVRRHYGISTSRYKLIHFYYDIDEWELYDLEKDPHELKNVYNDSSYTAVRMMLHHKLDSIMERYGDSEELARRFLPSAKQE